MKYLSFIFAFFFLSTSACYRSQSAYEIQKAAEGTHGMVTTAHPLATEAGIAILKQGGNAADAAIAIQFVLAVVYPRAGNIGGGGFLVYRDSLGNISTLDYREKAPAGANRDMFIGDDGQVNDAASTVGILAVGIPGSVAGMYETYRKHGQMKSWSALVEPSIKLAEKGFRITKREADRLNLYRPDFEANNQSFPFLKNKDWEEGDILVQEQLAKTLQLIAEKGAAGFYEGEHAVLLADFSKARNGLITTQDLQDYRPLWRTPLSFDWRKLTIHTMGLPSSGGIILQQCLTMVDNHLVDSLGYRNPDNIHAIVEAERRAFEDRAIYLGDTDFVHVPLDSILSIDYLTMRFSNFDLLNATTSISPDSLDYLGKKESFETTHLSVVDNMGNAASVTTTLNGNYGSKLWVTGGGYFLNNEMDDFSVKPGSPNMFGLIGSEANAISPSKRMLSSMTPMIVEKEGKLWLIAGTNGGSTIPTSMLQLILNLTAFDMDFHQSVQSGRYHHQWLPDEIIHEKDAFSIELLEQLNARGHKLKAVEYIGFVKAIMVTDSVLHGAGDRRSDDHVLGY